MGKLIDEIIIQTIPALAELQGQSDGVTPASSGFFQILDEKVNDRLARFGCIFGARDLTYHAANAERGKTLA